MEEEKYQLFQLTLKLDDTDEDYYVVGAKSEDDLREHLIEISEFKQAKKRFFSTPKAKDETYIKRGVVIEKIKNCYSIEPYVLNDIGCFRYS